MEIISGPKNKRVWKAHIVSQFNGVAFKENNDFKMGETNRTEEFLKLNPLGQIPTLRDGNKGLFESNSIARYLARLGESKKSLLGKDAYESSKIDAFLDAIITFENMAGPWYYKAMKFPFAAQITKGHVEMGETQAKKYMRGFDLALKGREWFVGDSISLADIVWFCSTQTPFSLLFDAEFRKEIPHAVKHFRKLEKMKEFQAVTGETVNFPDHAPVLEFEEKATPPPRFHRLVTIIYNGQSVKFKIFSDSHATDIQQTIRTRFGLRPNQPFVLSDEDDCDVVVDGTLETGKYKLEVTGEGKGGDWELFYFNIRGRAEPPRLCLEDAGVTYKDRRTKDWPKEKAEGCADGSLLFGQVPLLKHGDTNVVQMNSILRYIGRKLNMYGTNEKEQALVEQIMDHVEDSRIPYAKLIYTDRLEEKKKAEHIKNEQERLHYVEEILKKNKTKYLASNEFTIADAVWFDNADNHLRIESTILDKFPLCKDVYERIKARPNIAAYLKSSRRPEKANNNGLG